MADNPWQEMLDELYDSGGRGAFVSKHSEEEIDEERDLRRRLGISHAEAEEAAQTLKKMDLAEEPDADADNNWTGDTTVLTLTGEGFDFAHNREQEHRNIRSNRSVARLTFVLAWIGMGQAMAATASVSEWITGDMAVVTTIGAGGILMAVYLHLAYSGQFLSDEI